MSALPQVNYRDPSSLSTTGLHGHIITGIFLQLLRGHFSTPNSIKETRLRNCVWVPKTDDPVVADVTKTGIMIEPVYKWDPRQVQLRPAVIIKRNDLDPRNRLGIGGNEQQELGGIMPDNLPEAGRTYLLPFRGSHTMFCIAQDGGAAELIATEVAGFLYQFARTFVEEFDFDSFELAGIGAVSKLEECEEHFAVPVSFSYEFCDQWRVAMQAPRFKGVSIFTNG